MSRRPGKSTQQFIVGLGKALPELPGQPVEGKSNDVP